MKKDGKNFQKEAATLTKAQRQEMVWLMRGAAREQSGIMWDVRGSVSDEVLGEGSRSPHSSGQDGEPMNGFREGNHMR